MPVVALLGDSITAENSAKTWAERLRQRRGVTIVNRAVGGQTIDAVSGSSRNILATWATDLTGYTPDVIVIFAGTNDVYYGATGAQATASLWTLVGQLQAAYPGVRVVVVEPLLRDGWLANDAQCVIELATYAANIVAGAAAHGCTVWRARQLAALQDTSGTAYNGDKIHPSAWGASVLAADFWRNIARPIGMRPRGG